MSNSLLERVPRCAACGAPEFRFTYAPPDEDLGSAGWWFLISREPVSIAGGITPASVCTACGLIVGIDGRAIRWNLQDGSPVAKLVPPVEQPLRSVYDAAAGDAEDHRKLTELIAWRGRWADDVDLEATALARLIFLGRVEGSVDPELLDRARHLLTDLRLGWVHRVDLHHQVGLCVDDPEEAHHHLSMAYELGRDVMSRDAFLGRGDERFALPDPSELAIDLAAAARDLDRTEEALRLLKQAGVPWAGDHDDQPTWAAFGRSVAEEQDDVDLLLQCELRLAIQAFYDEDRTELTRAVRRIRELIDADASGARRRTATLTLRTTNHREPAQLLLIELAE